MPKSKRKGRRKHKSGSTHQSTSKARRKGSGTAHKVFAIFLEALWTANQITLFLLRANESEALLASIAL